MLTSAISACLHCGAALTTHETAEGWCDSCGKRLPAAASPAPAKEAPRPVDLVTPGTDWLLWGTVGAVMLGVAGLSLLAYVR